MERVCFLLHVPPGPARGVPRAPPRRLARDARRAARRRAGATTRSSCDDDGLLVGYLETEDFEAAHAGDGRRPTSTRAGRRRWRRSSSCPATRARHGFCASRRSSTLPDPAYAAIDLGATSGRVVAGRLHDGRVELEEVHRFANRPVRLPDGLRWNLLHLFAESLRGCARTRGRGLGGIGVDTWGVDYALLDEQRPRPRPAVPLPRRAHGRDDRARLRPCRGEDLYAVTGIQTMPINTVFQLLAEEDAPSLAAAAADGAGAGPVRPLAHRRAGERAHERLDHRAARRAHRRLGARARRAARPAGAHLSATSSSPGTELGALLRSTTALGRRPGLRRRLARHRRRLRRRAGRRRARRDPLAAARGRCSASSCPRPCSARPRARRTSPTSAASTARRACSRT